MNVELPITLATELAGASDIRNALQQAVNAPFTKKRGQREQIIIILRHFRDKGKTLEWCSGARVLGRKAATLKGYCREANLVFPDYMPQAIKKQRELAEQAGA